MDRWNYARDEHPAYCTCVECIEDNNKGGRKRSRRSVPSVPSSLIGLITSWIKRLIRGR